MEHLADKPYSINLNHESWVLLAASGGTQQLLVLDSRRGEQILPLQPDPLQLRPGLLLRHRLRHCTITLTQTIDASCFLRRSSLFCLNASYYFKIDSTLTPSPDLVNCYYYNSSTAKQEEVALAGTQLSSIVSRDPAQLPSDVRALIFRVLPW